MASQTDICNIALQNIGANSISSITEGTVQADACNVRYEIVRKALLELGLWNFATKAADLNEDSVSPPSFLNYENQFVLPSDFIRVIATDKQLNQYGLIGNPDFNGYLSISSSAGFSQADSFKIIANASNVLVLLSNDSTKGILYVYDCQDESKFSPIFVELFGKLLGASIATKLTGNATTARTEREEAIDMLMRASKVDGMQGTYERQDVSSFLASRL